MTNLICLLFGHKDIVKRFIEWEDTVFGVNGGINQSKPIYYCSRCHKEVFEKTI